MSGGYFEYKQYVINEIADIVEGITKDDRIDSDLCYYEFNPRVINEIKKGGMILRQAAIYAQRIDWLMSGDDGDEAFLSRLKDDLANLK